MPHPGCISAVVSDVLLFCILERFPNSGMNLTQGNSPDLLSPCVLTKGRQCVLWPLTLLTLLQSLDSSVYELMPDANLCLSLLASWHVLQPSDFTFLKWIRFSAVVELCSIPHAFFFFPRHPYIRRYTMGHDECVSLHLLWTDM